jgi:hypothetical protein
MTPEAEKIICYLIIGAMMDSSEEEFSPEVNIQLKTARERMACNCGMQKGGERKEDSLFCPTG